jgi:hypothetical protein
VAERVVDGLEPVEVEEQQRRPAGAVLERLADELQQAGTVGRPVRSSWLACQASVCWSRTRSVMSVWVTMTRSEASTRAAWRRNQAASAPTCCG